MAHITSQEITVNLKGYSVTVPKGTRLTHRTALGPDQNYNFVADLSFIDKHSILYHDATYYGIDIPKEYVIDSDRIEASIRSRLIMLGIDPDTVTIRQHVAIEARIHGEWDNELLMQFGPLLPDTNEDIKRIVNNFK